MLFSPICFDLGRDCFGFLVGFAVAVLIGENDLALDLAELRVAHTQIRRGSGAFARREVAEEGVAQVARPTILQRTAKIGSTALS